MASGVKQDVLRTLINLLGQAGPNLRPLLPQMQSSFVRCLGDSSDEEVRLLAAEALRRLADFAGPRVDLLLKELSKTLQVRCLSGC